MAVVPFPSGQFFQIHGSKFKLHPVCHLSEATVLRVAHAVFFFCVGKYTLNFFFSQTVQFSIYRHVPDVLRHLHKVLPDMAQNRFLALCIFSALRSGGAVFAKVGSALVFPVSVPVCGGIMQRAVFRADHVVEIFIVNIRPPGMAVLLGFRAGVAGGWSAAALRVGCGYHRFFLFGRLFVTVVRKGLFSVFFPVFVYLFEQFSCMSLFWNKDRCFLFTVILSTERKN